jgi:EAL domain-containing protein (putative c-di-GMP-specific phosphodiesterase class I)
MAVRPPTAAPTTAAPAAAEPVTAESLGWLLRAALPPLRLHSVSLYDDRANVLWLSEGALGPDEHNLVLEAMETLARDTSQSCYENGLEDGRVAIFLPVRAPQGDLVGLAMILADLKSVGDGVLERLVTPQMRTVMQKIAVLLRATAARPLSPEAAAPAALELAPEPAAAVPTASAPPQSKSIASRAAPIVPVAPTSFTRSEALTPEAVGDILEFDLVPDAPVAETRKPAAPAATIPPTAAVASEDSILALELVPDPPQAAPPSAPQTGYSQRAPASPAKAVNSSAAAPTGHAPPVPKTPVASAAAAPSSAAPTSRAASPATSPPMIAQSSTPAATTTSATTSSAKVISAPGATGTSRTLGATGTSRVLAAADPASLILEVQPYVKLRPGGRSRRYEVLVRAPHRESNRDPAALDSHGLQRLLAWLGANRSAWGLEPTSFTLNLSIATLEDDRFPQHVASCLKANGIAADNIGFEIAEPLCTQRRAQVERFITLCDKLGCFVVIDDFSLDSSILPLLRSKALRLVKIDPKLTSAALKDKLAQAMVVAIAQAVKVLGIHCAAKRVESQASLQWLTAIGCDFAQGSALSQVQPLEALASAAMQTGANAGADPGKPG